MEITKVKTPKSQNVISIVYKRSDPTTNVKEVIAIGAIVNATFIKNGVFASYALCTPSSNALGAAQMSVKGVNGFKMKSFKIAGTGAKTIITTGEMNFIHQDNSQVQNKLAFSKFATEFANLDTLLTVPVEFNFNQSNGFCIDVSALDKDETIRLDFEVCEMADFGAE